MAYNLTSSRPLNDFVAKQMTGLDTGSPSRANSADECHEAPCVQETQVFLWQQQENVQLAVYTFQKNQFNPFKHGTLGSCVVDIVSYLCIVLAHVVCVWVKGLQPHPDN